MQHIFIKRLGDISYKTLIAVVILTLLISGCSSGRGDWEINITSNYSITHVNSRNICLTYKESQNQVGSSYVIEGNYFIRSFTYNEDYIGTEGIVTKHWNATDEEINSTETIYYLINISTGTVFGPFSSLEKFNDTYRSYSTTPFEQWYYTAEIDYKAAEEWEHRQGDSKST